MDLIAQLLDTKSKTLAYYHLDEFYLLKRYGEGKWTIKQILTHLADAESVLYDRIRRIIAEPKQVLWAFNQDLWCINLAYEKYPLELSERLFSSVRDNVIYLAGNYYLSDGHKEFIHSETGIRTLKDEFDKVASHNLAHLHQIETALSKE